MYASTPILLRDNASGQLLLLHENARRNGKRIFHNDNYQSAFCKVYWKSVPTRTQTSQGSGVWVTKPFQNWKKAVEKMRKHERSDNHKKQNLLLAQREQLYPTDAITDFVKAIREWTDRLLQQQPLDTPFFSLMAHECTDITSYLFTVTG